MFCEDDPFVMASKLDLEHCYFFWTHIKEFDTCRSDQNVLSFIDRRSDRRRYPEPFRIFELLHCGLPVVLLACFSFTWSDAFHLTRKCVKVFREKCGTSIRKVLHTMKQPLGIVNRLKYIFPLTLIIADLEIFSKA